MQPSKSPEKPKFKPNRRERRFMQAMKKRKHLNEREFKVLEHLEEQGADL